MKITDKLLCIPPYVSTSWSSVSSVYMRDTTLIVVLTDGEIIQIPHLPTHIIESIYAAHASYLEREFNQTSQAQSDSIINKLLSPLSSQTGSVADPLYDGSAMKLGFGMEGMGTTLQHNPAQADSPDLPPQMLQRISSISKIFAPEDLQSLPRAEPNCNCIHCQLIRAITSGISVQEKDDKQVEQEEEEISEADLTFREWDVTKSGQDLYTVANALDSNEKYSVYLGHPIGCTCGKQKCEHILAVLKS
jgi:hypothetical protein